MSPEYPQISEFGESGLFEFGIYIEVVFLGTNAAVEQLIKLNCVKAG